MKLLQVSEMEVLGRPASPLLPVADALGLFKRRAAVLLAILLLTGCSGGDAGSQFADLPSGLSATIHSVAIPEGAAGESTELSVRVSITDVIADDLEFSVQTSDGTATEGDDYVGGTQTLTIPAGKLSATAAFQLIGDDIEEAGEFFNLSLQSTSGIPLNNVSAKATIANDDTACLAPAADLPNRWLADDRRVLNYAHRGGVIDFPENTMYAYKQVAEAGADVLEMDVYETADGELVILHDLDVDRTTNGTGLVGEKTLAEIRELDAAHWFVQGRGTPRDAAEADYLFRGIAIGAVPPPPGFTAADFRIPTLEEALQAFPDELINVELKPDLDGMGNYELQVAELLRRYGRFDDVIVASFVDEASQAFKAAGPCFHTSVPLNQATGLVLGSQGPAPMSPAPEHVALQVPPDTTQVAQLDGFFLRIVTEDLIADAHEANLAIHVWTINECEEMLEMLELGVDAIMTDRPLLLEQVLDMPADQRSCAGL